MSEQELTIQSDLDDANSWLQQIRAELYNTVQAKAQAYNFNFLTESPSDTSNSRYQWRSTHHEEPYKLSRASLRPSMRSSISTLATDSEVI
jgi:hypothetical protein